MIEKVGLQNRNAYRGQYCSGEMQCRVKLTLEEGMLRIYLIREIRPRRILGSAGLGQLKNIWVSR